MKIEQLEKMNKQTVILTEMLLNHKQYRLAWRVWNLNLRIIMHELHKMRLQMRSKKLQAEHQQLVIDLYVTDFKLDLDKYL